MMSRTRVRAIYRKELRDYLRNRQMVVSMAILPLVFSLYPAIQIFGLPTSVAGDLVHKQPLIYMLGIPAIVPSVIAAYSVAGEREQGTLEPVLATPIRADEFLLGKALAALVPSLVVSFGVFGVFAAAIGAFSQPPVAAAVLRGPAVAGQLLFTPLIAALSIWAGMAISTRTSDPRIATQFSALATFPLIAASTTAAVGGFHVTPRLALAFGIALLLLDCLGWRVVARMVDRERLVTGTRARAG
jgi:ABC-type Na+ efflux pump permease subunit